MYTLISGNGHHRDSTRGKVITFEQALLCCGMSGEAAIVELEKLMDMALSWSPFLLVFCRVFSRDIIGACVLGRQTWPSGRALDL